MRIREASAYGAVSQLAAFEFEAAQNKLRDNSETAEDEAMNKVDEAQSSNTKAAFKMMDSHNDMVHKSQERNKEEADKRAVERLAQKRAEEHSETLEEMTRRNAERRDLLEDGRLKGMYL